MPDPLLIPSIAMLCGGGLLATRDYLKRRFRGTEDRYMALYGDRDWDASNMDLTIHFDPAVDAQVKDVFFGRLKEQSEGDPDRFSLLWETSQLRGDQTVFVDNGDRSIDSLKVPRRGVYFDASQSGSLRVVWNHMQTDGVGMWATLRTLFDENPPLVPYSEAKSPPPLLPELLALPATARRLAWRGKLRKRLPRDQHLHRGFEIWDAEAIRSLKNSLGRVSFNLVTSAMAVNEVFRMHPGRNKLTVGLTAYFPFLEGRNKYGVFLCKVRRAPLARIALQLQRQTRHPLVNWGTAANQSYALNRLSRNTFGRLVNYYRRQIDVLVSSLPVGQEPITIDGVHSVVSCHPWELTLPYYYLLVGTRSELHVSYTTRFHRFAPDSSVERGPS